MAKGQIPSNRIAMIGHVFGRLTVISEGEIDSRWKRLWNCSCSCGKTLSIRGEALRSGNTKSCGCLNADILMARNIKHGHSRTGAKTPTYRTWRAMMRRCHYTNDKSYPKYGAKGIRVCERWHTFENFLADMGERPADRPTIDRIQNTIGYAPGNCRWTTIQEQQVNRSHVRLIELSGRTQCAKHWAIELGVSYSALLKHIRGGMRPKEALNLLLRGGVGRCP